MLPEMCPISVGVCPPRTCCCQDLRALQTGTGKGSTVHIHAQLGSYDFSRRFLSECVMHCWVDSVLVSSTIMSNLQPVLWPSSFAITCQPYPYYSFAATPDVLLSLHFQHQF